MALPDALKEIAQEADKAQSKKLKDNTSPLYLTDEHGNILKFRTNLVIMLKTDPAHKKLNFNEFTHEIEMNKEPINDKFINKKLLDVEKQLYMKFTKDDMFVALEEVAHQNKYHPVKDLIERTPWDECPRAETLFIDYMGAEDNVYTRAVAKKWLAGAVKRIYEPGSKFEIVPVLQGAQGLGKSTLASKLGGKYFTDSLKGLGKNKDDYQLLVGTWIVELGELSSMRSTDTDTMKNFISASEDKVRFPYERLAQNMKRTVAFIGTTNPEQYLSDFTGNRRFFPLHSKGKPSKNVFTLDNYTIQQIWAEAFILYKDGIKPYIDKTDPEDIAVDTIADEYRKQATEYSTAMEDIQDYLNMTVPKEWYNFTKWEKRNHFLDYQEGEVDGEELISKTTVKEIMAVVMKVENSDRNEKNISKKVKLFLDNVDGWEAKPVKINGKTVRGYARKK
ncbi:VapE domain-containing protein [Jeotgalibaca porci]|uniref:VapE domain-containing protein n=1 Tax=Jeotgalibaca porci TaxID=1868793 RepID=UPI003F93A4B9